MGAGFAIVDLETTGLFPEKHDRIVEIGIVHVISVRSRSPTSTGLWTLLRPPGATHDGPRTFRLNCRT